MDFGGYIDSTLREYCDSVFKNLSSMAFLDNELFLEECHLI